MNAHSMKFVSGCRHRVARADAGCAALVRHRRRLRCRDATGGIPNRQRRRQAEVWIGPARPGPLARSAVIGAEIDQLAAECDLVISGVACLRRVHAVDLPRMCPVREARDSNDLERTDAFEGVARRLLTSLGYPEVPVLVTPNPVVYKFPRSVMASITKPVPTAINRMSAATRTYRYPGGGRPTRTTISGGIS